MKIAYNFLSFIKCVMQPSTAGVGGDIQLYTHFTEPTKCHFHVSVD